MRRALRGFFGGFAIAVQGRSHLAALNHHAFEFADVYGRIKTHAKPRAFAVPDAADADHGTRKGLPEVTPVDLLAQLDLGQSAIARQGVQRVPVAVPKLFGQKFERLGVGDRVPCVGQRVPQGFCLRFERVQRGELSHFHIFQFDADFALGACVANRPHKADVN